VSHPDVGSTLSNLGLVYRDQGKYVEAEELLKRALAVREKALGASHAYVGATLNNLALVHRDQGKDAEAEGLFERALAIRETALGASHPDVARTLSNMAILYEARGESGSALAYPICSLAAVRAIATRASRSWSAALV
jgi:tetratricopeptide (TPR) repeat protein